MANIKISELDELQEVADQDLFVIVDSDENITKKIQAGNLGILVPKTTKTTSDTETYSCNYVNNEVDKLLPENSKTTGTTNTYSCDYINGIIESGSNDNGNWIKYSDGTMKTYQNVDVTLSVTEEWGGIFVGNYATPINFPQTFKEPPEVLIDLKLRVGACFKVEWEIPIITTSSYKNIGIGRGTSSNAVALTITLYAIGKWK